MSTLVPVNASIALGANGKWTLTSSITDTSKVYGYSYTVDIAPQMVPVAFTMPANGASVEIDIGPVTLDPTIYVTIGPLSTGGIYSYITSTTEQLSSKITVAGGNATGVYTAILDYIAPTAGTPRKVYTDELFNSAINAFGFGTYPVHFSKDGTGRFAYLVGTSTSIAAAPAFTLQPASQAVALGQNVSFNCVYTSTGSTTAQWYKNGTTLVFTDPSVYVSSTSTFTINGIVSGDFADYTCKVTNAYGNTTSSIATLSQHVSVTPVLSVNVGSTLTVNEGSSASIIATLTAGTISVFNWYGTDLVFDNLKYDVPTSGSPNSISSGTGGYLWVAGATSTYTKTWTSADNGKVIHILANGWYAGDGSTTATVTVNVVPVATAPPTLVSSPPASLNINYGDPGSSISASFSGTGSLVYLWYISSDLGTTWYNLDPTINWNSIWSGGNTTTLSWSSPPGYNMFSTPAGQPLITAGVYWLRCACSNSIGTTYSNTCVWTLTDPSAIPLPSAYRPTAGTAMSIFPNAVDTGSATSVDSTTYSTKFTTTSLTYSFSGFGSVTKTGTLHLRGTSTTEENISSLGTYTAISSVSIYFSYNSGAAISLVDASSGIGDIINTTPITTGTLTNVDLSTLTVTISLTGERLGPIDDRAIATAYLDLYDIVFLT
jgi:hypothetical protein